MKIKTSLKHLQVPTCQRCCSCGKLKIAVAWQSIAIVSRTSQQWRFYCEDCSRKRGLDPSTTLKGKLLDEGRVKRNSSKCSE